MTGGASLETVDIYTLGDFGGVVRRNHERLLRGWHQPEFQTLAVASMDRKG
jgi:hypothetical protein